MRTFIDVWNTPEGTERVEIARLMESIGLKTIAGQHDWYFDWTTEAEFNDRTLEIHRVLQGTKALYRTCTLTDAQALRAGERTAPFMLPR